MYVEITKEAFLAIVSNTRTIRADSHTTNTTKTNIYYSHGVYVKSVYYVNEVTKYYIRDINTPKDKDYT